LFLGFKKEDLFSDAFDPYTIKLLSSWEMGGFIAFLLRSREDYGRLYGPSDGLVCCVTTIEVCRVLRHATLGWFVVVIWLNRLRPGRLFSTPETIDSIALRSVWNCWPISKSNFVSFVRGLQSIGGCYDLIDLGMIVLRRGRSVRWAIVKAYFLSGDFCRLVSSNLDSI
jgi:hypothetical protein